MGIRSFDFSGYVPSRDVNYLQNVLPQLKQCLFQKFFGRRPKNHLTAYLGNGFRK